MTAQFVLSAAKPEQFIHDGRKAVVFAGRSNVGKSSVINALTGRKNLARVGNTPGKTSHVNYFLITPGAGEAETPFYFVDLPGYGYSKVSHAEKRRWAALLEAFFARPEGITIGVLVADARHKPTALDIQMADLFRRSGKPFLTLANKIDKLKQSQIGGALELIRETLSLDKNTIPFSSVSGMGGKETLNELYLTLSGAE